MTQTKPGASRFLQTKNVPASQQRSRFSNVNKVNSGWFPKDGKFLFMRSSWELNYAHYLNFLVQQRKISKWEYEVDTFWFDKIKRGVTSYKPDFKVYNVDNTIEYHEVKGHMDNKSITKLKRMKLYHPTIKIVLIDKDRYNAIKKISAVVRGWGSWLKENPNAKK